MSTSSQSNLDNLATANLIYVTTLDQIRAHSPCASGWKKLLAYLGKTSADSEPLAIATILESNGEDDAIWCLRAVEEINTKEHVYSFIKARHEFLVLDKKLSKNALLEAWDYYNINYIIMINNHYNYYNHNNINNYYNNDISYYYNINDYNNHDYNKHDYYDYKQACLTFLKQEFAKTKPFGLNHNH